MMMSISRLTIASVLMSMLHVDVGDGVCADVVGFDVVGVD